MRQIAVAFAILAVAATTTVAGASTNDVQLSFIAYSTPKTVVGKIIQAWNATPDGAGVSFKQSYAGSTDQARAVVAGLPADVLFLSTGDDVNLLVDAGIVDANWDKQSYHGIGADSVIVFAVRPGNPKRIKAWADLIKPDVQVITPNPFASGNGKWSVLAAYGAQRALGKTDAQAIDYVGKLFKHVVSQDSTSRNATNTFLAGKGDVMITYESEALASRLSGTDIQYVIPRQTLLIELPLVLDKNSKNKDKATAFMRFFKSGTAQDLLGQHGWRPVNPASARKVTSKYPARPGIFKIEAKFIGGWRAADKKWFDPNKGQMVKIEQAVGGPTSG
jgi:sulfate/thiosulfate transport system substrate-binding protein